MCDKNLLLLHIAITPVFFLDVALSSETTLITSHENFTICLLNLQANVVIYPLIIIFYLFITKKKQFSFILSVRIRVSTIL